jgi:hypothetical protein
MGGGARCGRRRGRRPRSYGSRARCAPSLGLWGETKRGAGGSRAATAGPAAITSRAVTAPHARAPRRAFATGPLPPASAPTRAPSHARAPPLTGAVLSLSRVVLEGAEEEHSTGLTELITPNFIDLPAGAFLNLLSGGKVMTLPTAAAARRISDAMARPELRAALDAWQFAVYTVRSPGPGPGARGPGPGAEGLGLPAAKKRLEEAQGRPKQPQRVRAQRGLTSSAAGAARTLAADAAAVAGSGRRGLGHARARARGWCGGIRRVRAAGQAAGAAPFPQAPGADRSACACLRAPAAAAPPSSRPCRTAAPGCM